MKRSIFIISVSFVVACAGILYYANEKIFGSNDCINEEKIVFVPTGSDFEQVMSLLKEQDMICDESLFRKMADMKNYPAKIKPGKYVFPERISNNDIIDLLRIGKTTPVNLTFNYAENLADLAGIVSQQIEADSISLIKAMKDPSFMQSHRLNHDNVKAFFLPNTYEFYWHTNANGFVERMEKEYKRFWNKERLAKSKLLNMTPLEVSALASIVQKETSKMDEMPIVAGLYLNRLRKKMRLEADPTVIYALKLKNPNMQIRRVLKKDLKIDSPYNTYKTKSIPPGPICVPSIQAIDAVLQNKRHKYIFMCAKEDFSGYHNFASNLRAHRKNAKKYQDALNRMKVTR